MSKTWFISDLHLGHHNIIKFRDNEGKLIRPFDSLDQMHECIIERWNSVVGPYDRVYNMGDVVIAKKWFPLLDKLNGKSILLRGNHDIFKLADYSKYFEDIRSVKVYPAHGILVGHFPVHTGQLEYRFKTCVHGHTHQNMIDDPRYVNLCVENINYTPVEFDQLLEMSNR